MDEQKNNGYNLTMKLSTVTKLMVFGGIICIIVANCVTDDFKNTSFFWVFVIKIIEVIGTSLFSAGLVSVIVEISTIRNIVAHAFKNILSGVFELDGLSQSALIRLKQDISLKLLGISNKDLSNSPYKYEDRLLNSVNEKFYKHHNITYHITPDENNNCFHVKTKIDYDIVNKNMIDNFFEVRLKLYEIKNENATAEIGNNFSASVNINGDDIDTKDILFNEPVKHHGESTYYNRKIRIFKELEGSKNKIKAELNYDVPLFDICQAFKISAPCKNIEHKFYINSDVQTGQQWMIQANAYSTFFHRQEEEDSNYKVEQNVDDSLIIRYTDWALVGNGYCVFYQKKF